MGRKVIINKELCKGCELCIAACPKKLIVLSEEINSKGNRVAVMEKDEECNSCAICAINCPDVAIEVYK